MRPPEESGAGEAAGAAAGPPAMSVRPPARPEVLRRRGDFLRATRARRQVLPGFVLQARKRAPGEAGEGIRVGFTCSKKVGNAVARNRARRRLRETARLVLPTHGRPGWDYVLIGRAGVTAQRPFTLLLADLRSALKKIHGKEE